MTRVGRKANHAKSASARALRVGRPVSNGAKRARAVRHGPRSCKNVAPKPQPSAWNGVGAEGPWPTAWDGACRALAAKTPTPSPPVRVASWPVGRSSTWRSSPDPRVTGLGRCACSVANSMPPTWVGVSEEVPWPRCGVEYDARWPQSQPRQVRQSSLRDRSAGPPRGEARPTRAARDLDVVPAASHTHCRRRGSESVKRSLGQGAGWSMTHVGRKDNHAKSASARALRGGRPVSNGAKRARAARYGDRKPWSRDSAPAAVGLARCRCGRASANGLGWSASRVGREDNHAKSASAQVLRGRMAGSPLRKERTGRAARGS